MKYDFFHIIYRGSKIWTRRSMTKQCLCKSSQAEKVNYDINTKLAKILSCELFCSHVSHSIIFLTHWECYHMKVSKIFILLRIIIIMIIYMFMSISFQLDCSQTPTCQLAKQNFNPTFGCILYYWVCKFLGVLEVPIIGKHKWDHFYNVTVSQTLRVGWLGHLS